MPEISTGHHNKSRRYLSDYKNRWSQVESLAINSGVGTSVVHGMSVLVRVQTPEPIISCTRWLDMFKFGLSVSPLDWRAAAVSYRLQPEVRILHW